MSDIKREEIEKVIAELERRERRLDGWADEVAHAYRQSARLLRDLLDRAPDSPDPGGLY